MLIARALPTAHWQETLIGAVTLLVLIFWPRLKTRLPAHLVALLVGSLLAWLLGVLPDTCQVATIGSRFHYVLDGLTGNGIPPILPESTCPGRWPVPMGH